MDVMDALTDVPAGETSTIDQRAVAGSLDRLAEKLAAVAPGRLALIAGDEIDSSDAAAQTVALADLLAAPVYGSSWPAHIPFPTSHPLWAGNLPTRADSIAAILGRYDAVFALGGKSLITVLYSEGSAVPPGTAVFQLSADVRDLGRTYATALSTVGDIRASLDALLPLLAPRLADRAEAFATLREQAVAAQAERRRRLHAAADAAFEDPVIDPLAAAREVAARSARRPRSSTRRRDAHPPAHLPRQPSCTNTRRCAGACWAGGCRRRWASPSGSTGRRWSAWWATGRRCIRPRPSGPPRTRSCPSPSS